MGISFRMRRGRMDCSCSHRRVVTLVEIQRSPGHCHAELHWILDLNVEVCILVWETCMPNMTTDSRIATVKKLLEDPDLDYADLDVRRDVYDSITYDIVPKAPRDACPPLRVLIYAIRNIMEPSFVESQTMDLINLLAHVNVIRTFAVDKAQIVLQWNRVYTHTVTSEVRTLSLNDCDLLHSLIVEHEEVGRIYGKIMNACFRHDIYYLLLSGDASQTKSRLNLYFPGQFPQFASRTPPDDAAIQHLHQHDLASEDHQVTRMTGMHCAKLVNDATRFMRDPKKFCAELGVPLGSFSAMFPPPDESVLIDSVRWYLQRVDQLVSALTQLFPGQYVDNFDQQT